MQRTSSAPPHNDAEGTQAQTMAAIEDAKKRDYYEVLGIERTAEQEEVRSTRATFTCSSPRRPKLASTCVSFPRFVFTNPPFRSRRSTRSSL